MNAWLITWEGTNSSIADENRIVAILSSRKSVSKVADFVELLYLRSTSSAQEMACLANRPKKIPYKVAKVQLINNIPHGDRIICGHNPFLYARKVTNLQIKIDPKENIEILKWKEPSIFKWKEKSRLEIEVAKEGEIRELWKSLMNPLSNELKFLSNPE